MAKNQQKTRKFLQCIGNKGFRETLAYINENDGLHYNEIKKYLLDRKILSGTAWVTTILNGLVDMKLVDRTVESDTRPIRTSYSVNKKGETIIKYLDGIAKVLEK